MTSTNSPDVLSVAKAAHAIGTPDRPVSVEGVRKAARRLGLLREDHSGVDVIPVTVVEILARSWRATGYLCRRGARSLETLA